ncbi:MAG: LacI family DNA-binding transcriptional regulator [Acidimicrobiales bacterium]
MTIADVARRAGVSKGLVSLALNDRPGVAPTTRARILEAAGDLDWRPSQAALALTHDRAYAVGFVLARPASLLAADPFFPAFISGVETELSARRSALVLQVVDDVGSELAVYKQLTADRRVDGVIVADLRVEDPRPAALARLDLPAVTLGRPDGPRGGPAVVLDDQPGVAAAVEHLATLGHERIAYVAGPEELLHARHRRNAWRGALERLGLPEGPLMPGDFSGASGSAATEQLLDQSPSRRPSAVVFANDLMAVAGMSAAQRRGVRVPDELSVVGFDDAALAGYVHPPLTTVAQDAAAWGRAATRALLDLVDHGVDADVELPSARLVVRESTGAPRAGRPARRRPKDKRGNP